LGHSFYSRAGHSVNKVSSFVFRFLSNVSLLMVEPEFCSFFALESMLIVSLLYFACVAFFKVVVYHSVVNLWISWELTCTGWLFAMVFCWWRYSN